MPDKLLPIQLVFDHWKGNKGQKLESNKEIELSMGQFHSGTVFKGTIKFLDGEDKAELFKALKDGYQPTFWIVLDSSN